MSKNNFPTTQSPVSSLTYDILASEAPLPSPMDSFGSCQSITAPRLTAIINEALRLLEDEDFFSDEEQD
jgi:hypothetical protein